MQEPKTPAPPSPYRERVSVLIDRIDQVLTRGRETQARCEGFYLRHGLQPGFGEERLTAPALPEGVVRSTRAALALQQAIVDAAFPASPSTSSPSGAAASETPSSVASATAGAAVRALRSHTRI